jgi:very-short-patch-repair endonuclease
MRHFGIPVTTPARTILDHAPRMTEKALARALANLRREGHLHPATLTDLATRKGGARFVRFLTDQAPTRSEFEDLFLAFIRRYGLPTPRLNTKVNGREVDAFFPDRRLIVELDSWDFHRDRDSFESDRENDLEALTHDVPTVRITWEQFTQRPARVAAQLRAILS